MLWSGAAALVRGRGSPALAHGTVPGGQQQDDQSGDARADGPIAPVKATARHGETRRRDRGRTGRVSEASWGSQVGGQRLLLACLCTIERGEVRGSEPSRALRHADPSGQRGLVIGVGAHRRGGAGGLARKRPGAASSVANSAEAAGAAIASADRHGAADCCGVDCESHDSSCLDRRSLVRATNLGPDRAAGIGPAPHVGRPRCLSWDGQPEPPSHRRRPRSGCSHRVFCRIAGDVMIDCLLRQDQPLSDLSVTQALRHQRQHLNLTRGQASRISMARGRGPRGRPRTPRSRSRRAAIAAAGRAPSACSSSSA